VHDNKVAAVAFSRDNSRLASGGTETVIRVIRLSNGEVERSLGGHMQTITELAYTADGHTLISTARDGTAKWWDLTSPVEDPVATDLGRNLRAVISPDGKTLIVSGENTKLRAFELPSLRPIDGLDAPGGGSQALAISPSSDLVAAGGSAGDQFQVWDIKSGQLVRPLLRSANPFWAAGFTSDDCVVFGGFGKPLYAFNPRTGEQRWEAQLESEGVAAMAVDRPHNRLAVATRLGRILILDAATGQVTGRLEGHPTMGTASVAFFADGSRLVTGGHDSTARVWELNTGKETHVLRGHKGAVMSVAVMPDQRRIITGSMDNTVRIWDATQAEEVLCLRHHVGGVFLVGATNDGLAIISASDDGSVRVWDATK
jgi:WD40 repeat protein